MFELKVLPYVLFVPFVAYPSLCFLWLRTESAFDEFLFQVDVALLAGDEIS